MKMMLENERNYCLPLVNFGAPIRGLLDNVVVIL
jgi:hypothetical protein